MNAFGVQSKTKPRAITAHESVCDFLRGLPPHEIMRAVIDNLAVRSDFDPVLLERQANQIGQIAHERARHE